jgi:hypothetical protein
MEDQMAKDVIGIEMTHRHPSGHETWKVTHNGQVRGDARGYNKVDAIAKAKERVGLDPENRELHSSLQPVRDPATTAAVRDWKPGMPVPRPPRLRKETSHVLNTIDMIGQDSHD